jgi:hypothetical protein
VLAEDVNANVLLVVIVPAAISNWFGTIVAMTMPVAVGKHTIVLPYRLAVMIAYQTAKSYALNAIRIPTPMDITNAQAFFA